MGLGGGLVALAVWQQLLARGLVFQPYFAPWAVAFPVYGALYALLFRWRAARRPAAAP
jgi:ABC-type sugar transport system permease subunit